VGRLVTATIMLAALALPAAPARGDADLRLVFLGDIMAHDVNLRMRDPRDIYRGVEGAWRGSDLVAANFEMPVDPARPSAGYPLFNGTSAYLRAAAAAGVNVFSAANNHAFDGGLEGVFQTLRAFAALPAAAGGPVRVSGLRGNEHRPFLPESFMVRGARVGFLAVTQFVNQGGASPWVHVADYADPAAARGLLDLVKAVSPLFDLFIVSYHGDREYVQEPSAAKEAFFRQLLEAGAHIVFGHHPHVVQRYELASVKGARRLVMYSMGNFISGMTWRRGPSELGPLLAATGESYLLSVDVRCGRGTCTVLDARPIPVGNYMDGDEMVVGLMSDLASEASPQPAPWREYWTGRLALMRRFFPADAEPPAPTGPVPSASAR
jgi:hypothetical protein